MRFVSNYSHTLPTQRAFYPPSADSPSSAGDSQHSTSSPIGIDNKPHKHCKDVRSRVTDVNSPMEQPSTKIIKYIASTSI